METDPLGTTLQFGATRVPTDRGAQRIEYALDQVCAFLKLPLTEEHRDTPRRAMKWFESFARQPNYDAEKQTFLSVTFETTHSELVFETGLAFVALCPHHLLPYSGTASIAYIPNGRVVGISKLARALEYWTHYPVKQEDATANLADALYTRLEAKGVMVVMRAFHTCMGLRGVKQPDHQTGTSAVRGCFADDTDGCRSEFLRLANP